MGYEIVRYYFTRARVEEHVLAMTNQISKKNRNDCNTQDRSKVKTAACIRTSPFKLNTCMHLN